MKLFGFSVKCLLSLPFFWAVLSTTVSSSRAQAQENLGVLKVDKFFIEPAFSTDARSYSPGFSTGRSFLGASWNLDNRISARLLIGPKFMLMKPARYGILPSRDYSIVEGYGEVDTGLGSLRAGLIPLPFGFYGMKDESQQSFPDDLFVQSRFIQRRDYGGSYFISHNDFTTSIAVHNGESDVDEDSRYFTTGRWSYKGPAGGEYGLSGTTGRWSDLVTMREQKIRAGNIFAGFKIQGLGLGAEATIISIFEQEVFIRQAYGWHIDLEHPLWNQFGLQARYDFFEPHHSVTNDEVREFTLGLNYHSHYWNSVFYVLGTTRWEEGVTDPHVAALVVWKLTPLAQQQ
jgi:hypothetical protein